MRRANTLTKPRTPRKTAAAVKAGIPKPLHSKWETAFDYHWQTLAPDAPVPLCEFRLQVSPHLQGVRVAMFRFDRYFPAEKVAVELHGYGHHRMASYLSDLKKMRLAAELGYRVLCFAGKEIESDPAGMVAQIRRVLEAQTTQ